MKNYISYYVDINKSLQKRKIELLHRKFFVNNVRRLYAFKTRLKKFIELKKKIQNVAKIIIKILLFRAC